MGRIREEKRMIYNFYAEFTNAEEFTKANRSAEWKDICSWCLENGIRIDCFPVAIDDKIQAFFFCEVKNGTPISKSKDREKGAKVVKLASLVGLGDYELNTSFRRNS